MNKLALSVALCTVLAACASTTKFQDYPEQIAGPSAVVHVLRENSAFGSAVAAPVYVNRYLIGELGPGGQLRTRVPVGRVHVGSTTADAIVQAEAGGEYFLELAMPAQVWLYRPDFTVMKIDRARAQALGAVLQK